MEGYSLVFYQVLVVISGLIIGSFLSMLIYRLPRGISLMNPKRSICPKCKNTIKWHANIPLFSYLFLQGKCSSCKEKISLVYPFVEFITTVITVFIYSKLGIGVEFILIVSLFYLLILLSFIDLKYKAVPDYLLVLIVLVASTYLLLFNFTNFSVLLMFIGGIFVLELFVSFYIQNVKSKILENESLKEQRALGEGDIPIIGIIGGVLGVKLGIVAIFLAAILAIIPSVINTIINKDIEIPFIPFLAIGFFMVYIFDELVIEILKRIVSL